MRLPAMGNTRPTTPSMPVTPGRKMRERVFTTPHTNKCTWEETLNNIETVGPSSTIVATDLGQTTNPGLQEGFEIFIDKLLDHGFTEAQVKTMTQHNAASLLGAE